VHRQGTVRRILRGAGAMVLLAVAAIARPADGVAAAQFTSPPLPGFEPPGVPAFRLTAIDAGSFHTCGVAPDARAWCWGLNDRGQLGDGTVGDFRNSPVRVGSAFFFVP